MIILQNRQIEVSISPKGAEMQSLKGVKTGREYLWQGNPAYWSGRSPILFPAVGGLWNGTYRYDGRQYKMPKHGFMGSKEWKPTVLSSTKAQFSYEGTPADLEQFPFPFRVSVTYSLWGRKVRAAFKVENLGERPIYFQMGGHPGFNLPDFSEDHEVDGYIKLHGAPDHILRARNQGCLQPETFPVPVGQDGLVPLCVETFRNEALIFEQQQVHSATLLDRRRWPVVTVRTTAPCWLFWSMQDLHCPYVCFEPWYGLPDHEGFDGLYHDRPYIQRAEPGKAWEGGYVIEVY